MGFHNEIVQIPASQSFRLLRWDGSLGDVRLCDGPGELVPIEGSGERWHAHRAIELTYIASGEGTRFLGDHLGAIEAPELVLIGANLPHYWRGLRESSGAAVQIDAVSRNGLGSLPEFAVLDPLWEKAQQGLLFGKTLSVEVGERLRAMSQHGWLDRLTDLLGLLSELCDAAPGARPLCEKPFVISNRARHADAISQAIGVLVDRHDEELTIEELRQEVGLSRATLCRYFRQYTGRSVVSFLNSVRIDQARRLLVETTAPVSEIAFRVGFDNLSHFNRQFRRGVGESPREHRQRQPAQR